MIAQSDGTNLVIIDRGAKIAKYTPQIVNYYPEIGKCAKFFTCKVL